MKLDDVDLKALQDKDRDYLLNKGVSYYNNKKYERAFELYHLASVLGSGEAMSNLGYCYMYGRGVKKDLSLAVAYFEMAAGLGVVDSLYKLATLYLSGVYFDKNDEMAKYYMLKAINKVGDEFDDKVRYPSLFFLLCKEVLRGEIFEYDPEFAFINLIVAKFGYEIALEQGQSYYASLIKEVDELAKNPIFDEVKEKLEEMDDEDDEDFDDFDFLEDNPFM